MSELRTSRQSDVPDLRRLWQAAFGDSDAYLDIFFSTAYAPERALVLHREDELLGGAYWLDCALDGKKMAYIYAVAIDPAVQNLGYGTRLMEGLHDHLAREGYAAALLVPGSDPLRHYYRRFGYRTLSWHDEFTAQPGVPVPITRIDGAHYAQLRRQFLPPNSVLQESENLALLSALAFFYQGEDFIAAVSEETCLELLGNTACASGITASLDLNRCRFRTPGSGRPFAMGKSLTAEELPDAFYFGFGFD